MCDLVLDGISVRNKQGISSKIASYSNLKDYINWWMCEMLRGVCDS